MKFEIKLVFCALVVLTSSSQTKGQSTAPLPDTTPSSDPGEDVSAAFRVPSLATVVVPDPEPSPAREASPDHGVATAEPDVADDSDSPLEGAEDAGDSGDAVTTPGVTTPQPSLAHTVSPAAPSQNNSVPDTSSSSPPTSESPTLAELTLTPGGATYHADDLLTSSTPHFLNTSPASHEETPAPASASPSALALTPAPEQPTTQPPTTAPTPSSVPLHAPAVPAHQEVPSELNVGDEETKVPHHPSSPLDPLLAGLVSIFIVTTAIISIVLFLKFRQRTNHPEFHRLQDLPMDDLMEDTPLSRYTY